MVVWKSRYRLIDFFNSNSTIAFSFISFWSFLFTCHISFFFFHSFHTFSSLLPTSMTNFFLSRYFCLHQNAGNKIKFELEPFLFNRCKVYSSAPEFQRSRLVDWEAFYKINRNGLKEFVLFFFLFLSFDYCFGPS